MAENALGVNSSNCASVATHCTYHARQPLCVSINTCACTTSRMHLARRRSRRVVHPSTSPSILIQSRSCLLCLVRTLRLNSLAHWHSHHIIISCAVDLHLPRYEVFLAPLAAPPHDHVVDSLLTRSDSLAHRLSRARDQSLTTRQRPCEARSSTYTAVLSVTHTTRQVTRPVLCMQKQQTTQLNSSRALGTGFMFSGDNIGN